MERRVLRHRTILVVDDEDAARELLCRWLKELGMTAVATDNGHSGLSRLATQKERGQIDGVLLDLQLRHFGGMAVLREMRQRHPALPVIVMAGSSKVDKVWEAMGIGAREFLLKPFDHKVFCQKCSTVFVDREHSA